jgi:hypothetical protein
MITPIAAVFTLTCAESASVTSACDGIADKRVGISRAEYGPCAAKILVTLDTLGERLQRLVLRSDTTAWAPAQANYKQLRILMKRAGLDADVLREAREGTHALTVERWPNGSMRVFNVEVSVAAAQYMSALGRPNRGNLEEGLRRHALARQAYERFR